MTHEDEVAEALRRRLYAPSASSADVAAYLDRAGPPGPEPSPIRATGPRRRRGSIGIAVAGSVVLLAAGAVASGAAAARFAPAAAPPSAAVRWTSAPRDPGDVLVASGVVDGGPRADAGGTASAATMTDTVYATARGDTASGIAKRFGLCIADVLIALPYGFDPGRLPADQHLLLHHVVSTAPRYGASGAC